MFSYTDAHGIEIFVREWGVSSGESAAGPASGSGDGAGAGAGTGTGTGQRDGAATGQRDGAGAGQLAEPVGVVQLAHGIGEHSGRYDAFARALVRAGFAVYADDHRGHGETGRAQWAGELSRLGRLGPGGLRATEAAILQLTGLIRARHPGLPLVMLGHSWGSLMTQRILDRHPRAWNAVVLSGTALRTPLTMESGALNKRWAALGASGFEWLSRDPETAASFVADPLCFEADILKLFGLPDALRLYGRPARGLAPEVPIRIVSGGDDPLHRGAHHLQTLADAYRGRGVRDVTVKIYPEARHELLNELNREDVTADLITWMLDRIGA